jgi:hypothetical protein
MMTKDSTTTYQEGIKAAQIAHSNYYPLEAPSLFDEAVTATISAFLTEIRNLGYNVPTIYGEPDSHGEAVFLVQYVYDTFTKDESQGSHTRDRQFAIHLLGRALKILGKLP